MLGPPAFCDLRPPRPCAAHQGWVSRVCAAAGMEVPESRRWSCDGEARWAAPTSCTGKGRRGPAGWTAPAGQGPLRVPRSGPSELRAEGKAAPPSSLRPQGWADALKGIVNRKSGVGHKSLSLRPVPRGWVGAWKRLCET